MRSRLLLQVLAGGAAAEHMLLPAVNLAGVPDAANSVGPGSEACSAVVSKVHGCAKQTAPEAVSQCACCDGHRPVAAVYSSCSSYLTEAAPSLSQQFSLYGSIYSLCSATSAICAGDGAGLGPTRALVSATADSSGEPPRTTGMSSDSDAPWAPACTSMVGLFQSCTMDIKGFTDLPYAKQAPCYCCLTARGQASWTDEFDNYAQTCRDWARASGPSSVYSIASTFAGFCKKFSGACSATSTASWSEATATATSLAEAETPTAAASSGGAGQEASRTASGPGAASTGAASSRMSVNSAAAVLATAAMAVAFCLW